MTNKRRTNNPYDLCIFRPDSECKGCPAENMLDCRFDLKKLLLFLSAYFFIIMTASAALIFNGRVNEFYVFLIVLGLFSVIFFEFWEIRILCSHCPFYAEGKKTLHCCANYGSLKVWKYRPGPMSMSEKIQLMTGFAVLVAILLIPSAILTANGLFLWAIPPVIGLAAFGFIIKKFHCSKCFNFSCPLNAAPEDIVDEFLKRNPAMGKAWEKKTGPGGRQSQAGSGSEYP